MVSFSKTTFRSISLLLIILFVALAISVIYPFFLGVHEGLTSAELDPSGKIRTALDEYNSITEKNCQTAISSISSISGLAQTDSIAISPIVGNTNFTNAAKLQQIIALNSSTPGLLEVINKVQGQNYTALLKLLQSLPTTTNDATFNDKVKQQLTTVTKITNNTDMQSPYYTINTYVQNVTPSG
jgi:hypothetical protein